MEKSFLEEALGWEWETTFWEEFSIAEKYGPEGIQEHYDLVFNQWKDDLKHLTELVLVLNWKIWMWYQKDDRIGRTYDDLWRQADAYALEHLEGDNLLYYLSALD